MKELTSKDLSNLKYGDKVIKISQGKAHVLKFVSLIPNTKNYLIFSDGEHIEHLYISVDGRFSNKWYKGDVDNETIAGELISWHEKQIKLIKKIYLKATE